MTKQQGTVLDRPAEKGKPGTKAVGVVEVSIKAVADSKDPNGEFEAVLSAPTLDRDGEIVAPKAFDPLPDRIGIDIDHLMSVRGTVASGEPYYDGDVLKFRGSFASTPLGQEVRTLVTEGHIWKMSVAFMNAKRELVEGVPHVVSGELLNAAIVAIPSNREADITAAKALAVASLATKVGARNSTEDGERLQQIHDLAVENGAECESKAGPPGEGKRPAGRDPEGKATGWKTVAGSYEERAERLREALYAANPDAWWVRVLATFEDSVVYALNGYSEDGGTYQATYSVTDDGVSIGSAEPVEVAEMIVPAKELGTDPESKAAAAAAASSPADTVLALARAQADEAEVLLT